MHDCPDCGSACYCDGEDHQQDAPADCAHICDDRDDPDFDPDPESDACTCEHERALLGPCEECEALLTAALARFAKAVANHQYDENGFTPNERGAYERSMQGDLFG